MPGRRPDERVRFPLVLQRWRRVAFLHWPVAPEVVRARLPDGLAPDVLDGTAWIGLTPFHVDRSGALGVTGPPGLTSFAETNLRTYVRGPGGRAGLWFLSLDVSSALSAVAGRTVGAPYFPAVMSVGSEGPAVRYRSRRRIGPDAGHDLLVEPDSRPYEPDALVASLTGRWRAFTRRARTLFEVRVEHEPWPLQGAAVVEGAESVTRAAGLELPARPPLVHYSTGVDARLGAARRAAAAPSVAPGT